MKNLVAAAFSMVLLSSCSSGPANESKQPLQRYKLHGEIVRLDPQGNIAAIRHQKIEGWMEAMTMQFPVKDATEFGGLHPNDCIDATVFVQGDSFWIGEVAHQNVAPGNCVQSAPPAAEPK